MERVEGYVFEYIPILIRNMCGVQYIFIVVSLLKLKLSYGNLQYKCYDRKDIDLKQVKHTGNNILYFIFFICSSSHIIAYTFTGALPLYAGRYWNENISLINSTIIDITQSTEIFDYCNFDNYNEVIIYVYQTIIISTERYLYYIYI